MLMQLENVSFSYPGGKTALSSVSVSIDSGAVVGVAGHNGAGKTTLLRVASGLLEPDRGNVTLRFERRKGTLSYVPDTGGFYPGLSALENVLFRAQIANQCATDASAVSLLEKVGLADCARDRAKTFSHGMKKRLAIACAYAAHPQVVILDESLNGIDPESLETIVALLKDSSANGVTVLVSSHDLPLLDELCTHILIMDRSRCVLFEPTSHLRGSIKQVYLEKTSGR